MAAVHRACSGPTRTVTRLLKHHHHWLQLPLVATMVAVPLLPAGIVALIRLIRRFVLFEWSETGRQQCVFVKRIVAFRVVERLMRFGDLWENGVTVFFNQQRDPIIQLTVYCNVYTP